VQKNFLLTADWVRLKGLTRHGKNRVEQHGDRWEVRQVGKFNGQDALLIESEFCTFKLGERKIRNWTWLNIPEDNDYEIVEWW